MYSVHEMVPLGTSTEALIHEISSETEQPPVDPDLVTVKFSRNSNRKIIITLVIIVIIGAVLVGTFVSNDTKKKDKEKSQRK